MLGRLSFEFSRSHRFFYRYTVLGTGRPQEEEDRSQEGKRNSYLYSRIYTLVLVLWSRVGGNGRVLLLSLVPHASSFKSPSHIYNLFLQKAAPKKKKAAPKKKTATKKVR